MTVEQMAARRLSIAMIVRDAASIVEATLASAAQLADEIVVADTGSTDNTRDLCAQFATRLIDIPWHNDFAAARNACFAETTGDWVLWLDAGERLPTDVATQLRDFVHGLANPQKAYLLPVRRPPAAGNFAGYEIDQIRLLPRRDDLRYVGRVREGLTESLAAADMQTETLGWTIQGSPHHNCPETRTAIARRNLEMADLEIDRADPQPRPLLARAEALAQLGHRDEARSCFQETRAAATPGSDEMLEAYYGELASYDGDQQQHETQLNLCLKALDTFPLDVQLLCALGGYLQAGEQIELAARAYQIAVKFGEVNAKVWHLVNIEDYAATSLSAALQLQDRHDEAQAVLENALAVRPESIAVRLDLIDLHTMHGRRKESLRQANRLPLDMPHREAFRSAVRGASLAYQQDWTGAQAHLETAYESGCRHPYLFRWLALTWFARHKLAAVRILLDEWRRAEPDNVEIEKYSTALEAKLYPERENPRTMHRGPRAMEFRVDGPHDVTPPSQADRPLPADDSGSAREHPS